MIDLNLRTPNVERQGELDARAAAIKTRVCMPGIIQSFDAAAQTVTVQPALREKMLVDGDEYWIDIPLLVDVPIVVPRAGGYALTLPIQAGDECLVVFGDMCIDGWWQSGGVQNQVLGLAAFLRRAGHDVRVLAPGGLPDEAYGLEPAHFTSAGAPLGVRYNGSVAPVAFGPLAAAITVHRKMRA